jgi:5-(carboxyamino)imidazole ribonucleotide synthase
VLYTTQHRIREKQFLSSAGIPVAPFRLIRSLDDLNTALDELGTPSILKTAGFGYDGKGQVRIKAKEEASTAWASLRTNEAVLEGFIDFERELSIIAARTEDGQFTHYGLVENQHKNHILDLTIAPAPHSAALLKDAEEIARTVLSKLEVIGVLCVELFLTRDQRLLVNELAPRPHNSGHWTIDACVTSQFEQQLRTVCGLPLGSTEQLRPAAMANLLGDVWQNGTPDWSAACAMRDVKLHLYGKMEARPGRKMGHLTALGPTPEAAAEIVLRAREVLTRR